MKRNLKIFNIIIFTILALGIFVTDVKSLVVGGSLYFRRVEAAVYLKHYEFVPDRLLSSFLYPNPDLMKHWAYFIKDNKLSVFRTEERSDMAEYRKRGSAPRGCLDGVKYEKGVLMAAGWADKEDGAPVSRVEVYIDKKLAGKATLGLARPDVPVAMKKPAWMNSGWQLEVKISVKKGIHSSYAVAYDKKNASSRLENEIIFKVE